MVWGVNVIAILQRYGSSTVDQIRQAIAPHKATGRTANSLRFEVTQEGQKYILRVFGRAFIMALETGRKATPQYTKPSVAFVQSIREWLQGKGKDTAPAYAIAKSIHQKGTKGTPGIISNIVGTTLTDQITKDIATEFAKHTLFNMVQTFRNGPRTA